MSSVIAVCVSFIGLALVLINAVIFIQMILSFPAMLSSNSQAYVQQQRKYHHIPPPEALDSSYLATSTDIEGAEAEAEAEAEDEEWVADESVDRWIDDVDEQTNDCSSEVRHIPKHRTASLTRGLEPMTRGRPLRRQRRRHVPRTVFRVKDDSDFDLHEDGYDSARGMSRDHMYRARSKCIKGWRTVEWSR